MANPPRRVNKPPTIRRIPLVAFSPAVPTVDTGTAPPGQPLYPFTPARARFLHHGPRSPVKTIHKQTDPIYQLLQALPPSCYCQRHHQRLGQPHF